jgi:hypothetical protein
MKRPKPTSTVIPKDVYDQLSPESQEHCRLVLQAQADIRSVGATWVHWDYHQDCEPIVYFNRDGIDSSLRLSCVTPEAVLDALRDSLAMLNIARDLERSEIL